MAVYNGSQSMTGQGRGFVGIGPKVYRIGKIVLTSMIIQQRGGMAGD